MGDMIVAIAERIKALREAKKMTQVRIGIELGVSQETISGYEIGKAVPPADMLMKLADCLGTSVDYLLGRTDNRLPPAFPSQLSERESKLLYLYKRLSEIKQERVIGYVEALAGE